MTNDFQNQVEKGLLGLVHEDICFFSWLCAVRALPFLGVEGVFSFWKGGVYGDKRQKYLASTFRALDIASHIRVHGDIAREAASAASAAYCNPVADSYAAEVYASYAAAAAAKSVVKDDRAAAEAATAAYIASRAAARWLIDIRNILLDDLSNIRNKNFTFNNDTTIYGAIWNSFQKALHSLNCGYWGDWYASIFSKGFILDDSDHAEISKRLKIPKEVLEEGAATVSDYIENVDKQGLVYNQRETRLIILGSAGAGKTTLVRRLNDDYSYPDPKDSTHGVDTSVMLNFNGTKAHIWDFGGQVIYHASHRCFMSANCVYILVVNARTEENYDCNRIIYWLDTIRVYSDNKAKVFIILNESDNRKQNAEDYDSLKDGEYAHLIQEIFSFNIGDDIDSVNIFKKMLADHIETTGHQVFGKNDSSAIAEIYTLFEEDKKILEKEELELLLKNNGIKSGKDQKRAKDLFNTLGVAMSYDVIEGYVLDPYWISHGVYLIIDYMQKNKIKFLHFKKLKDVFMNECGAYPKGKREYITELMEHHKIGFRNRDGVRGLIVPCVATKFKPRDIIYKEKSDSLVIEIERDELQEFPADFFYKYICANEDHIKKNREIWSMWQTGMVLAGDDASALVELKENRRIKITVWGKGKEEYSNKLELLFNDLLQEYYFASYKQEREKGGRIVTIITLFFESVAKGISKAIIEEASGRSMKP